MRRMLLLAVLAAAPLAAAPAVAAPWCVLSVEEGGPGGSIQGALAIVAQDGHTLARLPMGERPHEIAVSRDGGTAFVTRFGITDYDSKLGTPGSQVSRIDLKAARETARFDLPAGVRAPHGVKLRPPSEGELFVNAESGGDTMVVFDAASGAVRRTFPLPAGTHNFIFAGDGSALFSLASAAGVSRIDPVTGAVGAQRKFATPARGLAFDAAGRVLVGVVGAVVVLDPATLAVIETIAIPGAKQILYLAALPGGGIAAPSAFEGGVWMLDRAGHAQLVPTGKTPIVARVAPDGKVYAGNVEDDHLGVIDPATLAVTPFGALHQPNGLAFGSCPRGR